MSQRKSIIASQDDVPGSPLRRSSRINSPAPVLPITNKPGAVTRRRSSATIETITPAKIVRSKRLSLSQEVSEIPVTPNKRVTARSRAASKSPTGVDEKAPGTPTRRRGRPSISKIIEEESSDGSRPSTPSITTRRRSLRTLSVSPTNDPAENPTRKAARLESIDETPSTPKKLTRIKNDLKTTTIDEEDQEDDVLPKKVKETESVVKKTTPTKEILEDAGTRKTHKDDSGLKEILTEKNVEDPGTKKTPKNIIARLDSPKNDSEKKLVKANFEDVGTKKTPAKEMVVRLDKIDSPKNDSASQKTPVKENEKVGSTRKQKDDSASNETLVSRDSERKLVKEIFEGVGTKKTPVKEMVVRLDKINSPKNDSAMQKTLVNENEKIESIRKKKDDSASKEILASRDSEKKLVKEIFEDGGTKKTPVKEMVVRLDKINSPKNDSASQKTPVKENEKVGSTRKQKEKSVAKTPVKEIFDDTGTKKTNKDNSKSKEIFTSQGSVSEKTPVKEIMIELERIESPIIGRKLSSFCANKSFSLNSSMSKEESFTLNSCKLVTPKKPTESTNEADKSEKSITPRKLEKNSKSDIKKHSSFEDIDDELSEDICLVVEDKIEEKTAPKKQRNSLSDSSPKQTPNKIKRLSVSLIDFNTTPKKPLEQSNFKSPKAPASKKPSDNLLLNELEMTDGSDGSFHLNLSLSTNSQEIEEKLNLSGGSNSSDKENYSVVKKPNFLVNLEIGNSTPKIDDVSMDQTFQEDSEEEENCNSPMKKVGKTKKPDNSEHFSALVSSFVDELHPENLNEVTNSLNKSSSIDLKERSFRESKNFVDEEIETSIRSEKSNNIDSDEEIKRSIEDQHERTVNRRSSRKSIGEDQSRSTSGNKSKSFLLSNEEIKKSSLTKCIGEETSSESSRINIGKDLNRSAGSTKSKISSVSDDEMETSSIAEDLDRSTGRKSSRQSINLIHEIEETIKLNSMKNVGEDQNRSTGNRKSKNMFDSDEENEEFESIGNDQDRSINSGDSRESIDEDQNSSSRMKAKSLIVSDEEFEKSSLMNNIGESLNRSISSVGSRKSKNLLDSEKKLEKSNSSSMSEDLDRSTSRKSSRQSRYLIDEANEENNAAKARKSSEKIEELENTEEVPRLDSVFSTLSADEEKQKSVGKNKSPAKCEDLAVEENQESIEKTNQIIGRNEEANNSKMVENLLDSFVDELKDADVVENESDLDSDLDDLIMKKNEDFNDESNEEVEEFIDDMAIEGEEDTPSEGSNDIPDDGESLHSSESDSIDFSDDEYEGSFIDSNESVELLSGNEYDLTDSPKKTQKRKKSRIITIEDSSDEEVDVVDQSKNIKILENIEIVNKCDDLASLESIEQTNFAVKTPNNSLLENSTPRSKRKTSISIQENIPLQTIDSFNISDKISSAVDFIRSSLPDKTGNISVNVLLDYANQSNSSEEDCKKLTGNSSPRKSNVFTVSEKITDKSEPDNANSECQEDELKSIDADMKKKKKRNMRTSSNFTVTDEDRSVEISKNKSTDSFAFAEPSFDIDSKKAIEKSKLSINETIDTDGKSEKPCFEWDVGEMEADPTKRTVKKKKGNNTKTEPKFASDNAETDAIKPKKNKKKLKELETEIEPLPKKRKQNKKQVLDNEADYVEPKDLDKSKDETAALKKSKKKKRLVQSEEVDLNRTYETENDISVERQSSYINNDEKTKNKKTKQKLKRKQDSLIEEDTANVSQSKKRSKRRKLNREEFKETPKMNKVVYLSSNIIEAISPNPKASTSEVQEIKFDVLKKKNKSKKKIIKLAPSQICESDTWSVGILPGKNLPSKNCLLQRRKRVILPDKPEIDPNDFKSRIIFDSDIVKKKLKKY